jgi:hypothetical protein
MKNIVHVFIIIFISCEMNIDKSMMDELNPTNIDTSLIILTDSNESEGSGSYYNLDTSKSGRGSIVFGDSLGYADFVFTAAGAVTLIVNSSNVFTSLQTGTNHVIIKDNGTNVRIVNELGSTTSFKIDIIYDTIPVKETKTLIIILGESNAGGNALNSDATAGELAARSRVKIWNNNINKFESLDIGTNNLLKHTGLESTYNVYHGFELQLAYYTEADNFGDTLYIIKAGHGGTRIANWSDGTIYSTMLNSCWNEFKRRYLLTKPYLDQYNLQIEVLITIGINDAVAQTTGATFKTKAQSFIDTIVSELNPNHIYFTEIMQNDAYYIAINDKIIELDTDNSIVTTVSVTGAALKDTNHWSYAGMKTIVDNMVTAGL